MGKENGFDKFSNKELARAIELMIAPSDLGSRQTMIAILESQDFTPEEVKDQLAMNQQLNCGPMLAWSF